MGLKSFNSLQVTLRSVSAVVLPDVYVPGARTDADRTVNVNDYAVQRVIGESSGSAQTPQEILVQTVTIPGGGSVDIDLTAAPIIGALSAGVPAAAESVSGLKLAYLEMHTDPDNTADVQVQPGASDGYLLFGAAITDGIKIPKGSHLALFCETAQLPTVGAAAKNVTIAGTPADKITVIMVFEDPPAP